MVLVFLLGYDGSFRLWSVMIGAHSGFLDRAVHAFDLAISPGMVGLGQLPDRW